MRNLVCAGCGRRIEGGDYRVVGMEADGRGIPTNVHCHPGCISDWKRGVPAPVEDAGDWTDPAFNPYLLSGEELSRMETRVRGRS